MTQCSLHKYKCLWGVEDKGKIQVSKRELHTHTHTHIYIYIYIYLDYFRVEFLSHIKKNSHIIVIMLNITNRSPRVFLLLFFMWNRILLLSTLSVYVWNFLLETWTSTFTPLQSHKYLYLFILVKWPSCQGCVIVKFLGLKVTYN